MRKELFVILLLFTTSAICSIVENLVDYIVYPDNFKPEFVTKCFGDLGCFYTGPPFYNPKFRPVTVPPANNTVTKFYLFTPDKPNKKYELKASENSLKNSKFNGKLQTKVLIHGFITKNLSDFYKRTSLRPCNIHLIAHSLGAHMAGWVGTRIKNIKRISGFGLLQPIGDINFYPNGGNRQPGCISGKIVNITVSTKKKVNICSHSRAVELYTASINNPDCQFFATRCSNWESFEKGDCQPQKSKVRRMGFHAKKLPRVPKSSKFYLKTSAKYPFCQQNG